MAIKKSVIIEAVITTLKTITTANGYYTDLGSRVYESRTAPFGNDEIPAINIRETEDPVEGIEQQGAYGIFDRSLQLEIDVVSNGKIAPSDLREVEADINKAIGTNLTWGGNATMTYPVAVVSGYSEHDLNKLEKKTIVIRIDYKTIEWSET